MKKLSLILILLFQIHTTFGYSQSVDPSSKKIIGTWYNNANRSIKWMFTQDGKVYSYNKDIFAVTYKYTISHSCGNNSDDTIEYLTLMDKDGDEFCFKINGIDENKNGILSMTNMSNMEALTFVNKI
ncbi:hypothetical protein EV144_1011176 [Flavobacterium sp. 270]|uniref:hypothetical protein n=1 Tax=Flavobacterium sp. 270 TaxID=2512114 RepID=UPI001066CE17|nr:hypothetical protein [Flavobacterium sp. 270]TDW52486.1 hypothetical protein EV144_1011176 [Flavobacterium sp. 270]